MTKTRVPLIVHIIFRLDTGGLENGLVNLVNRIPDNRYRHAIICLTDFTEFRNRIVSPDIPVISLHKRAGKDLGVYFKVWKVLRQLNPDAVHTRNLGTIDMVVPAWLAGVKHRIHGEHGWDMVDLHGDNVKYRRIRRLCQPLITQYITVSKNLSQWLSQEVGVPERKIVNIYNGVDTDLFMPTNADDRYIRDTIRIGTVGRLSPVKDQLTLVRAFGELIAEWPVDNSKLQLSIVGDGPMRTEIQNCIHQNNLGDFVTLEGEHDRIDQVLRRFDLFVLPSLNEGISNTILEAMATGLPVVATNVGGNPELVDDGKTGFLVPPSDPHSMSEAVRNCLADRDLMMQMGVQGRAKARQCYSLKAMVNQYITVYDSVLAGKST